MKKFMVYSGSNLIAVFDNHTEALWFKHLHLATSKDSGNVNVEENDALYFEKGTFELACYKFTQAISELVDKSFTCTDYYSLFLGDKKISVSTSENLEQFKQKLLSKIGEHNLKGPIIKIEKIERPLIYDFFRDVLVQQWLVDPTNFSTAGIDLDSVVINLDNFDQLVSSDEASIDFKKEFKLLDNEIENEGSALERTLL